MNDGWHGDGWGGGHWIGAIDEDEYTRRHDLLKERSR